MVIDDPVYIIADPLKLNENWKILSQECNSVSSRKDDSLCMQSNCQSGAKGNEIKQDTITIITTSVTLKQMWTLHFNIRENKEKARESYFQNLFFFTRQTLDNIYPWGIYRHNSRCTPSLFTNNFTSMIQMCSKVVQPSHFNLQSQLSLILYLYFQSPTNKAKGIICTSP